MPNYLGQTPMGHLVEDDAGAVFHLPEAPTWGTPNSEPAPAQSPQPTNEGPWLPPEYLAPQTTPAPQPEPVAAPEPEPLPPMPAPVDVGALPQMNTMADAGQVTQDGFALKELAAQNQRQMVEHESAAQLQDLQQRRAETAALQKQQAKEMAARQAEVAKLQRDADAAELALRNDKENKGRWWASRSTGDKWGMVLAMVASGIGQAMQGKDGNPAVNMFMQAINDDLLAQREAMARNRENHQAMLKKVGVAQQGLTDLRQQHGIQVAAIANRFADVAEERALRMKPGQAQVNMLNLVGDLRTKAGESMAGTIKEQEQLRLARSSNAQGWAKIYDDRTQNAFKNNLSLMELEAKTRENALKSEGNALENEKKKRELSALTIPGVKMRDGSEMVAPTETEAKDLRKSQAAATTLLQSIGDLKALVRRNGGIANLPTKEKQTAQQLASAISASLKDDLSLGAWDNGSKALAESLQGGVPTGAVSFLTSMVPGLEQLEAQTKNRFNNKVKAMAPDAMAVQWPEYGQDSPETEAEKAGKDIGKAAAGARGQLKTFASDGLPSAIDLPTTPEAYQIIKEQFNIANSGTGNASAGIASLEQIANNPEVDDRARRAASIALSAIGKVDDLDKAIWGQNLPGNPYKINYQHPDYKHFGKGKGK